MDPILYNAVNGGRADFERQGITANNLANINTPGFKADLYQAQSLYTTNGEGSTVLKVRHLLPNPLTP